MMLRVGLDGWQFTESYGRMIFKKWNGKALIIQCDVYSEKENTPLPKRAEDYVCDAFKRCYLEFKQETEIN